MVSSRNQSLHLSVLFLHGINMDNLLLCEYIPRNKAREKVISSDQAASSNNEKLFPSVSKKSRIYT